MLSSVPRPFASSRHFPSLLACLFFAVLVAGCSSGPVVTTAPSGSPEARVEQPARKTNWHNLPGWSRDQPMAAWSAFRESCKRLERKPVWAGVCRDSQSVDPLNAQATQHRLEERRVG